MYTWGNCVALTARLLPQSMGEAPTISPWRRISSRIFRRNVSLLEFAICTMRVLSYSSGSAITMFLAIRRGAHGAVLALRRFMDCLIRGCWNECQWLNGRDRLWE